MCDNPTVQPSVYHAMEGELHNLEAKDVSGTGYVTMPDSCLELQLQIPRAGWYTLTVQYANLAAPCKQPVYIDGVFYGCVYLRTSEELTSAVIATVYLNNPLSILRLVFTEPLLLVRSVQAQAVRNAPEPPQAGFTHCNPMLSASARKLLGYLGSIYGKGILTGQHTTYPEGKELDTIKQITGKYPALRGFDLLSYSHWANTPEQSEHCREELAGNAGSVEAAIRWAKDFGGIVTFCWHWFSPLMGKEKSFYTKNTGFRIEKALQEGSEEHTAVLADIDAIGQQLKRLQNEDIPVLWRPLHEADGRWFWWGNGSAGSFCDLYRLLYHRLTSYHGLNNLIWVWNAPADGWYPGDDCVDIASTDIYAPPGQHGPLSASFAHTCSYGDKKPAALGENGPLPDPALLQASKTPWLWFLTWGGLFVQEENHTTHENLKAFYNHPYAITLEDLWKER